MRISRIISVIMALMISVGILTTAVFASPTATIDLSATHQTIEGWGASYTWYADWLHTNNKRETAYDWIFNDAGFNILRFRDLNQVNGDEKNVALDGYPAYKTIYDAAVARGANPIVLVTSWGQYDRSLPWVAYTEKAANGYSYYTLAKDENGEYMYDALADYVVESLRLFYDAGIPVDYYSISNEIELQERHTDEQGNRRDDAGFFLGQQETDDYCAYWKAHIAVYDAIHEAYGDWAPELLGAECMAGYADLLKGYLDPVIERRPETVSTVGHHLYGYDQTPRNFYNTRQAFLDYSIWQTEWYSDDYFGLANHIINALNYEDVNAWLFWNGAWENDRGVTLIEIESDRETAELIRGGNHYMMMHFSKFIRPGYIRVDVEDTLDSNLTAFKSPDGKKLVVVALNLSGDTEYLELDCGEEILGSTVYRSVKHEETRFRNKYWLDAEKYSDNYELPTNTLTTFVFDLAGDPNYVEPVVAEKEPNPFVKQPGSLNLPLIIGIVGAAVVAVAIVLVVVLVASKKKAKPASEEADTPEATEE